MKPDEKLYFEALLFEKIEKYSETSKLIKGLFAKNGILTFPEFELLKVAMKNGDKMNRSSIRSLNQYIQKLKSVEPEQKMARLLMEAQLITFQNECNEYIYILKQLDNNLTQNNKINELRLDRKMSSEDASWYNLDESLFKGYFHASVLKELGDYHRYLAEFEEKVDEVIDEINEFYRKGLEALKQDKSLGNPLRLSIYLSRALFRYEIQDSKKVAYDELSEVYEETIIGFNEVPEGNWKSACRLLKIMEANLSEWKKELKIID